MTKKKGKETDVLSCYEQVKRWINSPAMQDVITRSLPKGLRVGAWCEAALVYVRTSAEVQKCAPLSVMGGIITIASFGLRIDGIMGHAYLRAMPVKENVSGRWQVVGYEAQVQLGYKGLIELAYRNSDVQDIEPVIVYANDEFDFRKGTEPFLRHKWSLHKERGPMQAVYAGMRFKNGYFAFQIHPIDAIMRTRDRALEQSWIRVERTGNGERFMKKPKGGSWSEMSEFDMSHTPWIAYFEPMALKTAIWRSHKFWPTVGTDFARAANLVELDDEGLSQGMADIAAEQMTDDMRKQAEVIEDHKKTTQVKTRQRGDQITRQMAEQAAKDAPPPSKGKVRKASSKVKEKAVETPPEPKPADMTDDEIEEIMQREQEEWEAQQAKANEKNG